MVRVSHVYSIAMNLVSGADGARARGPPISAMFHGLAPKPASPPNSGLHNGGGHAVVVAHVYGGLEARQGPGHSAGVLGKAAAPANASRTPCASCKAGPDCPLRLSGPFFVVSVCHWCLAGGLRRCTPPRDTHGTRRHAHAGEPADACGNGAAPTMYCDTIASLEIALATERARVGRLEAGNKAALSEMVALRAAAAAAENASRTVCDMIPVGCVRSRATSDRRVHAVSAHPPCSMPPPPTPLATAHRPSPSATAG